jgi:hypothetical protein
VPNPTIKNVRQFFKYNKKYSFRVNGSEMNQVGSVTLTDGAAIWEVDQRSIQVAPDSVQFDATPKPRPGPGGTGALTITVTNQPNAGGGQATATGSSYYTGT